MIKKEKAIVTEILQYNEKVTKVSIKLNKKTSKAINYNNLTGIPKIGDSVLVNTGAVYLGLGTGGYDFVIHNYNNEESNFSSDKGHIFKLRYTPLQLKCMAAEEPDSPYHNLIKNADNVKGLKVLIGSLHSMLLPAVHIFKYYNSNLKIAYIMTDSSCLSIAFSDSVSNLKKLNMLDYTITCGQSFGGDFETVNIYTALICAKYICNCDIAIIIPGPGIVGTSTLLGFSGIEEGHIIDCVNTLKGLPFVIPRISFADKRQRHNGISHHTITVLSKIAYSKAFIGIPLFESFDKQNIVKTQIITNKIDKKHIVKYIKEDTYNILKNQSLNVKTMGRGLDEDKEFFEAVGASVKLCNTVNSFYV